MNETLFGLDFVPTKTTYATFIWLKLAPYFVRLVLNAVKMVPSNGININAFIGNCTSLVMSMTCNQ